MSFWGPQLQLLQRLVAVCAYIYIYMQVKPLVLIKALAMLHIAVVQGSRKEGHSIHLTPLCRVSHPFCHILSARSWATIATSDHPSWMVARSLVF